MRCRRGRPWWRPESFWRGYPTGVLVFVGHPDDDDPFHLVNHARSGEIEAAGVGWDAVAAVLKPRVDAMFSDATWRTWFGEAVPRKLEDGVLTITVSDWFT